MKILIKHFARIENSIRVHGRVPQFAHHAHLRRTGELRQKRFFFAANPCSPVIVPPRSNRLRENLARRLFHAMHLVLVTFVGEKCPDANCHRPCGRRCRCAIYISPPLPPRIESFRASSLRGTVTRLRESSSAPGACQRGEERAPPRRGQLRRLRVILRHADLQRAILARAAPPSSPPPPPPPPRARPFSISSNASQSSGSPIFA